ncbi:DUF262 domain-containing protein [Methylophilus sp. TWE2]|uniref:DUF262 domain-containing protein n=1 Tax=Methylophilus sp. TWE2 TaxID=1662285 RepID=UPI0009E4488E|nr:DUF262 domain-containing protein [Methylophilus sp. TWE2]
MDPIKIQDQLDSNRKTVSFDSYDITVRQLYDMVSDKSIDIAPEYQRHFIWKEDRQSLLIESIFLGIPVPSLFMATNKDSTWEVVDGLQRLTTLVNFVGDAETIQKVNPNCSVLKLKGLEKLSTLNDLKFSDLPKSLQLLFMTRPIRITVLNDRSDLEVRYDLFERLNTGGIILHPQEIRNCIFIGRFNDVIKELARDKNFINVLRTKENLEELVLKFFAYYQDRELFVHGVKDFLNEFMEKKTKEFNDENNLKEIFKETFRVLNEKLPDGIVRGNRKNSTPLVLYEAISVGVADAIKSGLDIDSKILKSLLDNEDLRKLTTGATNSKLKLKERIDFVKAAFI